MPSSANGVVGLKPTYGRVSRYGVLPMAPSPDHVGPMARRVSDAAIMFDAIWGFDPQDPTSLHEPPPNVLRQLDRGIKSVGIGVDRSYALELHLEAHAQLSSRMRIQEVRMILKQTATALQSASSRHSR